MYDCVALKDEIQKKLDKMQEPPPVKQVKPLPRPDDAPRKKRGGKRCVNCLLCTKGSVVAIH